MEQDTQSRLLFFGFIFYVLCLLGLQTGHLYWLLLIHTDLRTSYGLDPQTARHCWGFAGAAFLLVIMVAGPFCVVSIMRRYADVECSWMGGRQWIMLFWPISLIIYNGQVILFIVSTVNLYVDLKWGSGVASCACHYEVDPLLNLTCLQDDPLGHCKCQVPKDGCAYQLSATDITDITDTDLERIGSDYSGNVSIQAMTSLDEVNQWVDAQDLNTNFQYMLVLVKFSALVTVLHFPLWLLDHYLIQMAAQIRKEDPDPDDSTTTNSTRKTISQIVSELMVHTIYCFSENIDGFSLLDEYLQTSDYFWRNGYLRDAILAFVGTNILLVASYNGVSRLLKAYVLVSLIVRCLIVVLNNLPFMIIRIYMLWTIGGGKLLDAEINTNLFFFVSKEAVFLIVYFMECGFSIYQYRLDKKTGRSYAMNRSDTDKSLTGSFDADTGNELRVPQSWPNSQHDPDSYSNSVYSEEHDKIPKTKSRKTKPRLRRQNSLLDEDEMMDDLELDINIPDSIDNEIRNTNPRTKQKRNRSSTQRRTSNDDTFHDNRGFDSIDDLDEMQVYDSNHTARKQAIPKKRKHVATDNGSELNGTTEVRYKAPRNSAHVQKNDNE